MSILTYLIRCSLQELEDFWLDDVNPNSLPTTLASYPLRHFGASSIVCCLSSSPLYTFSFTFYIRGLISKSVTAALTSLYDPANFVHSHAPLPHGQSPPLLSTGALTFTFCNANLYLTVGAITILITWYSNERVVRSWLVILVLADLGHLFGCYKGMGNYFWDIAGWNEMAWANVLAALALLVNRLMTIAGVFGQIRDNEVGKGKHEMDYNVIRV